jgi:hypothetical protein
MSHRGQRSLNTRVIAAAEEALARQGFVTPIDVCLGLGWLRNTNVDDWRLPAYLGDRPRPAANGGRIHLRHQGPP